MRERSIVSNFGFFCDLDPAERVCLCILSLLAGLPETLRSRRCGRTWRFAKGPRSAFSKRPPVREFMRASAIPS